mgnify:CR=1 FL=1
MDSKKFKIYEPTNQKNLYTAFTMLYTDSRQGVWDSLPPREELPAPCTKQQNKPIAAMCIAPVLLANVLDDITITLGDENCGPARDILNMGAHHQATKNGEVACDLKNKIFTTPCFMLDATLKDIYEGAYNMVKEFVKNLD